MPIVRIAARVLLALAAVCGSAAAHDFWIVPARYEPHAGEVLAVRLCVGDHARADPVARRDERIVRFVLAGTRNAASDAPVVGRDGGQPAGLVRLVHTGPQVLGYRSNRAWLELEPAKFEAYLREEGLDNVVAARAAAGTSGAPGREVYSRCAKALLLVRDDNAASRATGAEGADGESPTSAPADLAPPDRALGFPLELVAQSDPHALAHAKSDGRPELEPFSVRLLHDGKPLAGVLVKASLFVATPETTQPSGTAPGAARDAASGAVPGAARAGTSTAAPDAVPVLPFGAPAGIGLHARTDAEGRATFTLPRPGTWLITAVHMQPAAPGAHPDTPPSATGPTEAAAPATDTTASAATSDISADPPTADWESLWASLSFEVPAFLPPSTEASPSLPSASR